MIVCDSVNTKKLIRIAKYSSEFLSDFYLHTWYMVICFFLAHRVEMVLTGYSHLHRSKDWPGAGADKVSHKEYGFGIKLLLSEATTMNRY